jgi:hypothetical protein
MNLRRLALTIIAPALLLAACESPARRALEASPDYKAGYNDGCATAGSQGANSRQDSTVRDEAAYRGIPAYHSGWGSGFNACRMSQAQSNQPGQPGTPAMPGMPGMGQ